MAEIIAAITAIADIGAVVSTVVSTVSLILSGLQFFAILVYFAIKIAINIISNGAYLLILGIFMPIQGTVAFLFYRTKPFVADITGDKFDDNPILQTKATRATSLTDLIAIAFQSIRNIVMKTVVFLGPLFMMAPWILFFSVVFAIGVVLLIPFQFMIFAAVDYADNTYITLSSLTALILNNFVSTWVSVEPAWNAMVDFVVDFGRLLFGLACPATVFTDDFSTNCPPLYSIYVIINTQLEYWGGLLTLLWETFRQFLITLGEAICPQGVCPSLLCIRYMGTESCIWSLASPEFIMRYTLGIVTDFVTVTFFLIGIQLFFFVDFFLNFYSLFAFLFRRYLPPDITTVIDGISNNPSRVSLSAFSVPSTLAGWKSFYVFILNFSYKFFELIAQTLEAGINLVDGLLCNLFIQPYNCGGDKICKAFLRPFTLKTALGNFYVDLPQILCKDVLKIQWNPYCVETCDKCPWLPFGLPLNLPWWYEANEYWFGPLNKYNGYSMTPCNARTSCCNPNASVLQRIFPPIF